MPDTVGELTNIIGGNLKALFGGGCHLGLPVVTSAAEPLAEECARKPLLRVAFQTQGLPFLVEVCQRSPSPAPEPVSTTTE